MQAEDKAPSPVKNQVRCLNSLSSSCLIYKIREVILTLKGWMLNAATLLSFPSAFSASFAKQELVQSNAELTGKNLLRKKSLHTLGYKDPGSRI